jgi:hypothetical protein
MVLNSKMVAVGHQVWGAGGGGRGPRHAGRVAVLGARDGGRGTQARVGGRHDTRVGAGWPGLPLAIGSLGLPLVLLYVYMCVW